MVSSEARFAPGDWYAVVGDAATVVLPVGQRDRVAALWDLADSGADADALLDALLAGGLTSLDHFVLVAHADDTTRVIVRGAPSAVVSTAAGDEVVSAAPGTTWSEKVVAGATSVRVVLAGDAETAHALTPGLARVSVVEFGQPTSPSSSPSVSAAPAEAAPREEPVAPVMSAEPEPTPEPVAEPTPEPVAVADPVAETATDPEPVAEPVAEPEPAAQPVARPIWESMPVPGADSRPAEPVAAPAPFVPEAEPVAAAPLQFGEPEDDPTPTGETPVVQDDWDRDGLTQAGAPIPEFDRPPIPGQEMAPEVVAQPVASLVFSTGDVVAVDRTVLVGRAPEARRFASHDQPHVVTVPSPHQEISSTHLEIRPGAGADHGSAIATDLGSTNGTVLALPGLDSEELKPGIAVSLVPGAVLDLGDGVTIQVTHP